MPKHMPLLGRFEQKFRVTPGCWEWTGSKVPDGYGQMRVGNKLQRSNRLSHEFYKGPIPEGFVVMHSCDNPSCGNPDHLSAGLQADNVADMVRKGRQQTKEVLRAGKLGEKNGSSKLTTENVHGIRRLIAAGLTQSSIATLFGVSQAEISRINTKKKWSHI